MWYFNCSLPIRLTLLRIFAAVSILPFSIIFLLPINNIVLNIFVAILFLLVCATDFFDGYYARKSGQVTQFGATLDHVADKILLYSTVVSLVAINKLAVWWALIWVVRELVVMGLRIVALENSISITVSTYGKSKTVAQILCLAVVIGNAYHDKIETTSWLALSEGALLLMSTFLSVVSAYKYCCVLYQYAQEKLL